MTQIVLKWVRMLLSIMFRRYEILVHFRSCDLEN